jgi:photosystem II stability/assembly factor-like uncharacterized protein
MTLCLSVGGRTITTSDAPTTHVLVGSNGGIVSLKREGADAPWFKAERMLDGIFINALTIEPSTNTLFAATRGEGLFASTDLGRTWEHRDAGIPHNRVWIIHYHRIADALTLYAGTEPAHLYKSFDVGRTWAEVTSMRQVPNVDEWFFGSGKDRGHVKHISFDPSDPETIYVSIEVGSVLKSTDGGVSWRVLGGFYEDVHRLLVLASEPRHLWIATGEGLYESFDGGETWKSHGRNVEGIMYPDALIIHPERESLMFVAGATINPRYWSKMHATQSQILRSRDGGARWELLLGGLPPAMDGNVEAMAMETYPGGYTVAAGNTKGQVFLTDDEGEHWTVVEGMPPVGKDNHAATLAGAGRQG